MTIQKESALRSHSSTANTQLKQALVQDFVGKKISDLPTPSVVIDKTVLERNCKSISRVSSFNVKLRIHIKSHKTVEGTRLQLEAANTDRIAVSTLAEAHAMIHSDLTTSGLLKDVLLAFPVTPEKFDEVCSLAQKVERFQIFIDHLDTLTALEAYAKEKSITTPFHVMVQVNCGVNGAGVDKFDDSTYTLARRLERSSIVDFVGLYIRAGDVYSCENAIDALSNLQSECYEVRDFKSRFEENGVKIKFISIGSSSTVKSITTYLDQDDRNRQSTTRYIGSSVEDMLKDIDEVHAGAFAFFDRQQIAIGLGSYKDVALSVACRVASTYSHNCTAMIDGGTLAFSQATAPQDGFGDVLATLVNQDYDQDPEIITTVRYISQELGIVSYNPKHTKFELEVGQVVRVVPNNCSLAASIHLYYLIVENGSDTVVDVWVPVKGW